MVASGFSRRSVLKGLGALSPMPLAYSAWLAFLYGAFGNPWVFVKAQCAWERHVTWPWVGVVDLLSNEITLAAPWLI